MKKTEDKRTTVAKLGSITEILKDYTESSTIQGLNYIFNPFQVIFVLPSESYLAKKNLS
jgi:hypothetical protein